MNLILIIAAIVVIIFVLSWMKGVVDKGHKYDALKPRLDNLDNAEQEFLKMTAAKEQQLDAKQALMERDFDARARRIDEKERGLIILSSQKTTGFPWLASAWADFLQLEELKIASALQVKSHPAVIAADKVRESAQRRREAVRMARILKYQIEFYENLFPWLADLKDEEIEDELIRIRSGDFAETPDDDPAKKWLTPQEYVRLPPREKHQKALDRYWTKKKTKWEIGRDYERYVGWQYENKGSSVRYQGIIEGFDDLGRDLIATKGKQVRIVQCKYWSKTKTIHEKHIFQLYGTSIAYSIDNAGKDVESHFVTSTTLSERARKFAAHLGIVVTESLDLDRYPCIKCNISRRDGERIYHLPFDQQYDTAMIEVDRGECYVSTVAEAEDKGFRRAFRYHGKT